MNFAIDRTALLAARGGKFTGTETDQYLIPGVPGFRVFDLAAACLK